MSAHARRLQGRPGTVALLAIAFAFASVLGFTALAPASAFAAEQTAGPEVEICEGVTLVTSVDDDGVLRVEQVVIEGTATYSAAEGEAAEENIVLSPEEAADVIDLQSEEVLVALAAAYNGWYESNTGDWFYFVNGKWATGWKKIDGDWFCFKDNGIMRTGWYSDGTYWFYLRPSYGDPTPGVKGSMVTGWASIDGYWYYLDLEDGNMRHGWITENGSFYFLRTSNVVPSAGPEGSMVVDWQRINREWYSFDSSGAMRTGWFKSGGEWFYLAGEEMGIDSASFDYGKMVKGLRKIGIHEYFFYESGWFVEPPSTPYTLGAMWVNKTAFLLFGPDDRLLKISIDENGYVKRHSIM